MTAGALTPPVAGTAEDLDSTASDIRETVEGLSYDDSIFSSSSFGDDKDTGEAPSENEQTILGVGIIAAIIAGIANFWPQFQNFLP